MQSMFNQYMLRSWQTMAYRPNALAFVNKVLLEHSHAICLVLLYCIVAELNDC